MNEIPEFKFALREDLKDNPEFLPTKAEPLSTGWDVRAAPEDKKSIIIRPGSYFKIPMGFRCFCPTGWWYQLHPRSSSFTKKFMHNLIGTIDEAFPLELICAGQYIPDLHSMGNDLIINFGDPIAQIIPIKRIEMQATSISNEEIDALYKERNTERTGGFGSTG